MRALASPFPPLPFSRHCFPAPLMTPPPLRAPPCHLPSRARSLVQALSVLGMKKAGPQLGKVLAAAVDWQLAHPAGTKNACIDHLKQRAPELLAQ